MRSAKGANLGLKGLVVLKGGAGRGGNLDEGEATDHFRMEFKHPFDRPQTFENSLGVVHAGPRRARSDCLGQGSRNAELQRGIPRPTAGSPARGAATEWRWGSFPPGSACRRGKWSRIHARCGFRDSGQRSPGNSCSEKGYGSRGWCCRASP